MLYCPHFLVFPLKNALLSLKSLKKPILQNLQGLPNLKVLENRFLGFFNAIIIFFNSKSKNIRDSTALLCLWIAKVLYCP